MTFYIRARQNSTSAEFWIFFAATISFKYYYEPSKDPCKIPSWITWLANGLKGVKKILLEDSS